MSADLTGLVAVVTGAASGIGAATASYFTRCGAQVVHVDVKPTDGLFVRADVSDPEDWQRVVATAVAEFGGVDCLVSNAVTVDVKPVTELSLESWNRQLAVNLTGTFLGAAACLDQLTARRGSIVVVSSVHALVGMPGHPAYAASKGGLMALTRQLAVDYGPDVRVNAVVPGPIMTAAWDRVDEAGRASSVDATVLKRFGRPGEVAAVAGFLASADASYVTGASIVVDGGWSIVKDSA
jgi:NAD(P)-dependent dehydrogenase (short-subunit alcohol dehydrogenase family)